MFKQIILSLLVVAVVKSQNISAHNDDYISMNKRQYASNINDYDVETKAFEKNYFERIYTINTTADMLEQSLVQSDERLNPLEILSDFSRQCVVKYRSLIPTIAYVKTSINSCILAATNQLINLLAAPRITRNNLAYYYDYSYPNDLLNCNKTYVNTTMNYTICITSVTSASNIYTINNQKTFDTQMDTAECSATANIKKALDCSFAVQNRTISLTAQANTLIDRCLQGLDKCGKTFNSVVPALN